MIFDICIFASPSTRARTGRSMSVVVLSEMYRDFELGDILSTRKQRGIIIQSPDLFGISRYQNQCNQCRLEDSQQPRYPRLLFDSFFMYNLQQRLLLSAKKRLFGTGRKFECKSCFWHSTLEDCMFLFCNSFRCWDRRKVTNRLQLFETPF